MNKILCSVEILTRNSAATLTRCLESVKDFDDVMVVDGGSTDATREIAERAGVRLISQHDVQHEDQPIEDFAAVRNRGLAAARHKWFLYVDSDEHVSKEAAEEIRAITEREHPEAFVWRMRRVYTLEGVLISCSLGYPNMQTRFFHKDHVRGFIKAVHERIEPAPRERVQILHHPTYVPLLPVAELRAKADRYIAIEGSRLAGLARVVLARKILHTLGVIARNIVHIRKVILCGGMRLPFIYEWLRFEYHLKLLGVLAERFFLPKQK